MSAEKSTSHADRTAELMMLGQIYGIVLGSRYGLRYAGYVGTQDNLVRR